MVGESVGLGVVGVNDIDGEAEGDTVGRVLIVGEELGEAVGLADGSCDGLADGIKLGFIVFFCNAGY